MNHEERDCLLRALNNAAQAKNAFLSGAEDWKILHYLDGCLSWAYPLLGVEHPMLKIEDPVSQLPHLGHEDIPRPKEDP